MSAAKLYQLGLVVTAFMIVAVSGCSDSGGTDVVNLNGTWQSPSQQKVVISLTGERKVVSIGDKTLPVAIKSVAADTCVLTVSDTAAGEKALRLSRVWDDNGKSFTLKFEYDGRTENLERVKG
jgi:hypothetical protein